MQRPHWSYSAISQYLACPLRFYFQRVLCLPQATIGSSLVLGSAVHAALAEYHRRIQCNQQLDKDCLQQTFVSTWKHREDQYRVTYRDGETLQSATELGIALVELYVDEPPPTGIVAIEQPILAPLSNSRGEFLETPLLVVADLITEDSGRLTIREFKTSARAYSVSETENSLQPTCYVNALHQKFGQMPEVEYTIFVKTKSPKIQHLHTERTESDLGRLGDVVENVERAIAAGVFYPVENPLNCTNCPYRQPCREWGRPENFYGIKVHHPSMTQEAAC